jgi:hypothetical protein
VLAAATAATASTAAATAASPHPLLTVSHDLPVRQPFASLHRGSFRRLFNSLIQNSTTQDLTT